MGNYYKAGGVRAFTMEAGQSVAIRWEQDCTAESAIVRPVFSGEGEQRTITTKEEPGLKPLRGYPRKSKLRTTLTATFTPPKGKARPHAFDSKVPLVANSGGKEGTRYRNKYDPPRNKSRQGGKVVDAGDFDLYELTIVADEPGVYVYKVEISEVTGSDVAPPQPEAEVTITVTPSKLTHNREDLLKVIRHWFPSSSNNPRPPTDETFGLMELAGWQKDPATPPGPWMIPQFEPRDHPIYDTDPPFKSPGPDTAFTREGPKVSATSPGRLNWARKAFYNGNPGGGGVLQRQQAAFKTWLKARADAEHVSPEEYKIKHKIVGPFPTPIATSCNDIMNVVLAIWGTKTTVNIGTMAASVEASERPDRYAKKAVKDADLAAYNARRKLQQAQQAEKDARTRAEKTGTEANKQALRDAEKAVADAKLALKTAEDNLETAKANKAIVDKVVTAKNAERKAEANLATVRSKAKQADTTLALRKRQYESAQTATKAARERAEKHPGQGTAIDLKNAERTENQARLDLEEAQRRSAAAHGAVTKAETELANAQAATTAARANMPETFEPYLYYKFAVREYADPNGHRPRPGDILFLSQSQSALNEFAHVCILISASETTWVTADGGGGKLPDQEAGISNKRREKYDLKVGGKVVRDVPGILSTTDLKVKPIHGWVNLDELVNPNYNTDLTRKAAVNLKPPPHMIPKKKDEKKD